MLKRRVCRWSRAGLTGLAVLFLLAWTPGRAEEPVPLDEPGFPAFGPAPDGPPTDSVWRYDNGVAGTGRMLYENRYRAVSFNTGPAAVTCLYTYNSGENGLNHAGFFAVHDDSLGAPGRVLWTSPMVYIESMPRWRSMACSVPVTGRFHVAFFPYEGSVGKVAAYWDNNFDQAPARTQWRFNTGHWYPDANQGDLMIRCFASTHDVGVAHWLAPAGVLDSGSYVIPACTLHNPGDYTESFKVHMRIGAFYRDSVPVYFLGPRSSLRTSFQGFYWNAPTGQYLVTCSTFMVGDREPKNDVFRDTVRVVAFTGVGGASAGSPGFFRVAPNPFTDRVEIQVAPGSARTGLQVCDAAGRIVRVLGMPSSGRVVWDARDALGRRVPPGVYLVRRPGVAGPAKARLVRR